MSAGDVYRRFPTREGGFPVPILPEVPKDWTPPLGPANPGIPEGGGPVRAIPPSEGLRETAGQIASEEAAAGRRLCLPNLAGMAYDALPGPAKVYDRPPDTCVYWSDVIVYAAAVGMVVLGALSVFRR